jgi:Protein of unknown function (DUF2934)
MTPSNCGRSSRADVVEQEDQVSEKPTKSVRRRVSATRAKARTKKSVEHSKIAARASFIYLDEGRGDEFENWLRAERELTAA